MNNPLVIYKAGFIPSSRQLAVRKQLFNTALGTVLLLNLNSIIADSALTLKIICFHPCTPFPRTDALILNLAEWHNGIRINLTRTTREGDAKSLSE